MYYLVSVVEYAFNYIENSKPIVQKMILGNSKAYYMIENV